MMDTAYGVTRMLMPGKLTETKWLKHGGFNAPGRAGKQGPGANHRGYQERIKEGKES